MITFARFPAGDPVPEPGNGGAVAAQVAEVFATADEARARELDRLIAAGYGGTDPRRIPPEVLHQPQEDEMAAQCRECGKQVRAGKDGVVKEKCQRCRVKAGEYVEPASRKGHRATKVEEPAAEKSARKPPRLRDAADLYGLTTQDLLKLRGDVEVELRGRLQLLDSERRVLQEAIGTVEITPT